MTFGLFEVAILLFIVFLLLGPKRVTGLFQALGRGVRDFTTEFGKDKEDKKLTHGDEGSRPSRREPRE